MDDSFDENESPLALLEYPNRYPLKVMGLDQPDFEPAILAVIPVPQSAS